MIGGDFRGEKILKKKIIGSTAAVLALVFLAGCSNNSQDGTGQYVHRGNDSNTNDQLTWKKNGFAYIIKFEDDDGEISLKGKMENDKFVLSGENWTTQELKIVSDRIDMDSFLGSDKVNTTEDNSDEENSEMVKMLN